LQEIEQVIVGLTPKASSAPLWSESSLESEDRDPPSTNIGETDLALPELVFLLVAGFRRHPHTNNVLTHISGGNWLRIEQALFAILDPNVRRGALSPLAIDIIDLMCAERGITGRILKPYYRSLLTNILGKHAALRPTTQVTCLFIEHETASLQAGETVSLARS
jgi:hypothetical protein